MEILRKIWSYLTFQKQASPTTGKSSAFNLKAMHTINKISIFMFLAGSIFLLIRWML